MGEPQPHGSEELDSEVTEEIFKEAYQDARPRYVDGQRLYFLKKALYYAPVDLLSRKILNNNRDTLLDNRLRNIFEVAYWPENHARASLLLQEASYRDAQLSDYSEENFKRTLIASRINADCLLYLKRITEHLGPSILNQSIFLHGMSSYTTTLEYIHRFSYYTNDQSGAKILQIFLDKKSYKDHLLTNSLEGLGNAILIAMINEEYTTTLDQLCAQLSPSLLQGAIFGTKQHWIMLRGSKLSRSSIYLLSTN